MMIDFLLSRVFPSSPVSRVYGYANEVSFRPSPHEFSVFIPSSLRNAICAAQFKEGLRLRAQNGSRYLSEILTIVHWSAISLLIPHFSPVFFASTVDLRTPL